MSWAPAGYLTVRAVHSPSPHRSQDRANRPVGNRPPHDRGVGTHAGQAQSPCGRLGGVGGVGQP
ncbi:MAG UNVERIFIED_CONTAM: hypothetical protein LVT10_00690 [Anaerolineae bacterium]